MNVKNIAFCFVELAGVWRTPGASAVGLYILQRGSAFSMPVRWRERSTDRQTWRNATRRYVETGGPLSRPPDMLWLAVRVVNLTYSLLDRSDRSSNECLRDGDNYLYQRYIHIYGKCQHWRFVGFDLAYYCCELGLQKRRTEMRFNEY